MSARARYRPWYRPEPEPFDRACARLADARMADEVERRVDDRRSALDLCRAALRDILGEELARKTVMWGPR